MYENFEKLPEEKKKLIIDICVEEFSSHGYAKASTNVITSKANISKGILFHYFKSKKNLYTYIISYVSNFITEKMIESMKEVKADDFFTRLKEFSLVRTKIFFQYPNEYNLIIRAIAEPPDELKREVEKIYLKSYLKLNELKKQLIFSHLNKSQLRDSVSIEKAIEFSSLLFDQLSQKYLKLYVGKHDELLNDFSPLTKDIDSYIDLIKYGIYKNS